MRVEKTTHAPQLTFFFCLTLIICFSVPFSVKIDNYTLGILSIAFLSSIQLAKTVQAGWQRLHEQIFWVFCFIWLGLAPYVQQISGIHPLPFYVTAKDYANSSWIILFSLILYSLVVEIKFKPLKFLESKEAFRKNSLILPATYFFGAISILIIFKIGPTVFFQSREDLNKALFQQGRVDNSQGAIMEAFCCVPIFVVMLALRFLTGPNLKADSSAKLKNAFRAILVLNIFVNNPISQGRFWFCTVWGSLFLVQFWSRSRKVYLFPILGISFILLIFPVADVFRYSDSTVEFHINSPVSMLESKGDFDSFEQIVWGMKYVEMYGFTNGTQLLGAATFLVPRSAWPEKPRDTGIVLARAANFGNPSISAPIWIEGYIDGGIFLMSMYMILIAYLHSKLRDISMINPEFSLILILYQLVILRGSLIASMGFSAVLFMSVYFVKRMGYQKIAQ